LPKPITSVQRGLSVSGHARPCQGIHAPQPASDFRPCLYRATENVLQGRIIGPTPGARCGKQCSWFGLGKRTSGRHKGQAPLALARRPPRQQEGRQDSKKAARTARTGRPRMDDLPSGADGLFLRGCAMEPARLLPASALQEFRDGPASGPGSVGRIQ